MNKVILLGRLTKDPEIRYSAGSEAKAVAKFSLAVNRSYKKRESRAQISSILLLLGKMLNLRKSISEKVSKSLLRVDGKLVRLKKMAKNTTPTTA